MKYPQFMYRINSTLAIISGGLVVTIGFITVIESLSRTFFGRPSSWSIDLCCYFLIWAIFFASPWAYQEKGHVAVDLLREFVGKVFGVTPRRVMSFVGYITVVFVLLVLLRSAYNLAMEAISVNKLTIANLQIPTIYLQVAIIIGTVVMLMTVVFIILDIIAGGKKYL